MASISLTVPQDTALATHSDEALGIGDQQSRLSVKILYQFHRCLLSDGGVDQSGFSAKTPCQSGACSPVDKKRPPGNQIRHRDQIRLGDPLNQKFGIHTAQPPGADQSYVNPFVHYFTICLPCSITQEVFRGTTEFRSTRLDFNSSRLSPPLSPFILETKILRLSCPIS